MIDMKSENRRIVFVNQATGYLTIDIINEFVKEFKNVAVIYGEIRLQDIELDPSVKRSKVIVKSRESNLRRFNRWVIASIQIFFLLITKYRKYEVFYFSVPPFAYLSALFLRRRFSILMWDIYPDALKMAGISEKNLIYKQWVTINKSLLKRAYRIYTIGEGLRKQLSKYIRPERIIVIPLWSGIRQFSPVARASNPFILTQKLERKFIVQYSGNIGAGHNIETLIEAAKLTNHDSDIFYLIIGRGTKVEKVKDLIESYRLNNCRVLPYQPDNMIRYSLSGADLNVVLVEDIIAEVSVPSKVYNLFAVGSPIISLTPHNSEINRLVDHYQNGHHFNKNDFEGLAAFIIRMKNSPEELDALRKHSISASKDFTPANARKYFESYISND